MNFDLDGESKDKDPGGKDLKKAKTFLGVFNGLDEPPTDETDVEVGSNRAPKKWPRFMIKGNG